MTIEQLLKGKFKQNQSVHRILNEQDNSGFLSCGYVKKNTQWGSISGWVMTSYDCVWVLSGTGYYEDDQHSRIGLKAGDLIQRLPGVKHSSVVTSDDWMELYIGIGGPLYNTLTNMNVLTQKRPVLTPGLDYKLLEKFINFFDNLNTYGPLELPLLVSSAISILSRIHYLDKKSQPSSEEVMILEMSRNYMLNNLHLRLTVEDVANHVNMGYEKFRKMFTEYYNVSPGYYIQQNRIHQAQLLLGEDNLSIKEIASELGYTDTFTFSKRFKKLTTMTPSDFRKIYLLDRSKPKKKT
jgi:AraC-like DNA-binding protein